MLDRIRRKPPARQHRGVLDRGDQQPLDRRPLAAPKPGVSASELASVPPEVKTTFSAARADGCGDDGAGVLDQPPRLAALGMHRGRIAGDIPGSAIAALASGRSGVVAFQSR